MGTNLKDTQDTRIMRWLDSLKYDLSEDTRFSLLCPALDALLEQFEQEYGPISNIRSNDNDGACQDAQPDSDVQRQEEKPGTDESGSGTESYEHSTDITVAQPDPESEQLRLAVLSILPSANVNEATADGNKTGTDIRVNATETVGARTFSEDETAEGTTEALVSKQASISSYMSSTTSQNEATRDRQEQNEKRMKRKRKHRQRHHVCSKKARQDYNNNCSSLDARLEQFYVCPLTNRLIPKVTEDSVNSASDSSGTAKHSDDARHSCDAAEDRETYVRHREEKTRTRLIPRPRGFRKGTSLMKKATTRCLIRKALETGTYCCYRRCFLTKPVIYI